MPEELMPWHKTFLSDIEYDRVDLVKEGANSKAFIKLIKSRGGQGAMTLEEILKSLKPEHRDVVEKAIKDAEGNTEDVTKAVDEAVAEVKKERDDLKVELEELKEAQGIEKGKSDEEILKSIKDPAVRAIMETQIAKTKAAEAEVQKAREKAVEEVAIKKAKEVPNVGAEEDKLADVFKKLNKADEELAEEVFGIFKSASALIAEGGALDEVGKTGANADTTGDAETEAWGKIEKKADEIAKSESISKTQAVSKAISENPELYQAYLDSQR